MTAWVQHFSFEFRAGLRNANQLLMNYLFPLGFYALVGLVMTAINPTFRDSMVPAMVIFVLMVGAVLGLPSPLVEAREAGIFRSFKINGVPAPSILAIPALSSSVHGLLVSAFITLTARPLFGGALPVHWGAFVLLTLLTTFAMGAIAMLIGVVSTSARATVLWSQLIFLPSMLVGGLMMPLSFLPASVRPLAALLPSTHAMQAFMGLAYAQSTVFDPWRSVAILATSGILALALAIYLFNWDTRNSTRRGNPVMALLVLVPYLVGIVLG